jgi:hypothetical protein
VTDQLPPEPPEPEPTEVPTLPWYRHPLTFIAVGLIIGGLAGVAIIIAATGNDTPGDTTVVTTTTETIATTAPTTTVEAAPTTEPPTTTTAPPGAEQWIGAEFAGDPPGDLYTHVAVCLGDPLCAYALQVVGPEESLPDPQPDVSLDIMVWLTKNIGSQAGETLWRVVDSEEYTFSVPGIALAVNECYEGDLSGQAAFGIMEHPVYMDVYGIIAADLATESLHLGSGTGYVCPGGD